MSGKIMYKTDCLAECEPILEMKQGKDTNTFGFNDHHPIFKCVGFIMSELH